MHAIEIKHLRYTYANTEERALDDVTFSIRVGQKVAILGANGSGKSTLMSHLNGLLLPQEGEIHILGMPLDKKHLLSIRQKVGMVFDQPDNQLFASTVYEDIAFGPRNLKWSESQVAQAVEKVMKRLDLCAFKARAPHHLSLGQKKKVAIAGVLAMAPEILVLDEPFSGLDGLTVDYFLELLDQLHDSGKTTVISTHDWLLVKEWADTFIVLSDGKLVMAGDKAAIDCPELLGKAKIKTR